MAGESYGCRQNDKRPGVTIFHGRQMPTVPGFFFFFIVNIVAGRWGDNNYWKPGGNDDKKF